MSSPTNNKSRITNGFAFHNALLTVLADGEIRSRLLAGASATDRMTGIIAPDDWGLLSGLPARRLIGISRFFARQYYRERVVRLFRYVRLLIPLTGRDPCTLLQSETIPPILDNAVLGSPQTSECLLALIEPYLMDQDDAIQAIVPFWRDLVRYQATLLRVEAAGNVRPLRSDRPRRAASSRILDFDWDLPDLLQQLRTTTLSSPGTGNGLIGKRVPTTLLVACGRHGRITSVRCNTIIRTLLEAADGTRDQTELAAVAGISPAQASQALQQLQDIGALLPTPSLRQPAMEVQSERS